tara:strand:+ start:258 stop:701 length:444 start_codon:yes stop_codon:yes gene_type:complete
MVPCAVFVIYAFLNEYPECARHASRRKLTYEDLEDFRDADLELRKRFQVVFTRVQQVGGALCAGIVVMYGFHVVDNKQTTFEIIGVFGGLLSLYARIFGYISAFCVACLHKMKKKQQYTRTQPQRPSKNPCPDRKEPENAKDSNQIL